MRKVLCLAGCVLAVTLMFVGCGGSDAKSKLDAGDMPDAIDSDDDGGVDANTEDADVDNMPDAEVPGGTGVEDCVTTCETFLMTDCSTPAANFCESAQQNCVARYATHANCQTELEAMDACAATKPVSAFSCPLGTVPNEARPYNLTEDVCVSEAIALVDCLDG